jgi:uncharacterized membrane protein YidH (DUF202 family)
MDTQIRDRFARQRAELANERTLLAYIRTSLGFVFVGVPGHMVVGTSESRVTEGGNPLSRAGHTSIYGCHCPRPESRSPAMG